jgi:hypothetical protein
VDLTKICNRQTERKENKMKTTQKKNKISCT